MIETILFSHGDLSRSVLETVGMIIGKTENIHLLSNENKALADLKEYLKDFIQNLKAEEVLILTDIFGGSCWMSASIAAKDISEKKIRVISGFNLAMLVSLISKCSQYGIDELVEVLKSDAINGIKGE
ncbi:PTS sugar transporter subunit IIA [candidate division KSB1 bacterium]